MKASVGHIREKFAFTERRACRLLLVPISSYRYKPRQNDNRSHFRHRLCAELPERLQLKLILGPARTAASRMSTEPNQV